MNGLDQYLAVALNRSIDHSRVLAWLIGTVCDLPSLKMLPLGAMWFSGSAQSTRAPNSIADSHWGSSGAHRLTAYSGHRAPSPPTDAFEVAGLTFANLYETQKIGNIERRKHLAWVQSTLSQGKVFRGRHERLRVEVTDVLRKVYSLQMHHRERHWFLSNVFFEAQCEATDPRLPSYIGPSC